MRTLQELTAAVATVCPVDGINVAEDGRTVTKVWYGAEATSEQRAAADGVVAGWNWDATPPVTRLAPYDFLALFTDAESYAILTSADPTVVVARAKLQTIITYVDLTSAETINYVGYLAQQGLIAADRVAQILAGSPPA